jgi:hypothetical protein
MRTNAPLVCGIAFSLVAAWQGASADANYTVNVTSELNGLDVKIEPVANPGVLVVNLRNGTAGKIKCTVAFQADPQVPSRTFVFVEPGRSAAATLMATQRWFEVDVDVSCKPDG